MGVRRVALACLMVVVTVGLLPTAVSADSSSDTKSPWPAELTLNGLLETSYSWNANHPDSRLNQLRVFDFDDASFRVDEFELVAQHVAARPREVGFRVDMTLGSAIPRVTASAGLFRDAAGVAGDLDAHQAFVSYVAPLGSGVKIDAGKFITPVGAEVIDGYDGFNDQATRSLLFGYAIPFTHVGVRATTSITHHVHALLMVANGWDVARDNNRAKTVGGQLTFTSRNMSSLAIGGIWGPERPDNDADARSLIDLVANTGFIMRLKLGVNADWGQERFGPGAVAHWDGVALYAQFRAAQFITLYARAEAFDDRQGVRTGTAQDLRSFTLTPEWKFARGMILRGDARVDHSDRDVFEKRGALTDTQTTVMAQLLYAF